MTRIPSNVSGPIGLSPAVVVPNIGATTGDRVNVELANKAASSNLLSTKLQTGSAEKVAGMEMATRRWMADLADRAARDSREDMLSYNNYVTNLNYAQNERILSEKESQFDSTRDDDADRWLDVTARADKTGARNYMMQLLGGLAEIDGVRMLSGNLEAGRQFYLQMMSGIEEKANVRKNEMQASTQLTEGIKATIESGTGSDINRMVTQNAVFNGFSSPEDMVDKINSGELSASQLRVAGQSALAGISAINNRLVSEFGSKHATELRTGWNLLIQSGKISQEEVQSMDPFVRQNIRNILFDGMFAFREGTTQEREGFIDRLGSWGSGFDALTQLTMTASAVNQRPSAHEDPKVNTVLQEVRSEASGSSIGVLSTRIVAETVDPDGTFNLDKIQGMYSDELARLTQEDGPLNDHPMASSFNPRR